MASVVALPARRGTLAYRHHDVRIRRALPHDIGSALARVSRQRVQLCGIGQKNHDVRPLGDPLIISRLLLGIRINVARARVARQHVSNPDLFRLEWLLVHPSVAPSHPDPIKAHGFLFALGALAGLRREAYEIIIAFFKNSAVPVLHGRGLGDKRGCSAQGILDQRVPIRRGALGRRSPHCVSRAASLGDPNSRMLMTSVDGFLSYYPGRTENHHSQDSKPYHGHAPLAYITVHTDRFYLFDHLVGAREQRWR